MKIRMPTHLYRSVSILVKLTNFQSVHGTLEPQDTPEGGRGEVSPGHLNLGIAA